VSDTPDPTDIYFMAYFHQSINSVSGVR